MYDQPRDVVAISTTGRLIDLSKLQCTVEAPPRVGNKQAPPKDCAFPQRSLLVINAALAKNVSDDPMVTDTTGAMQALDVPT
jgi:hypothetical protein